MSRTKHGSKPPGYEYWSPRPGNKHGGLIGPEAKKLTHHIERQEGKRAVRDEALSNEELQSKTIHMPPQECPVCGKAFDGRVNRLLCDPPIDQYPCGCELRYAMTWKTVWSEEEGWIGNERSR